MATPLIGGQGSSLPLLALAGDYAIRRLFDRWPTFAEHVIVITKEMTADRPNKPAITDGDLIDEFVSFLYGTLVLRECRVDPVSDRYLAYDRTDFSTEATLAQNEDLRNAFERDSAELERRLQNMDAAQIDTDCIVAMFRRLWVVASGLPLIHAQRIRLLVDNEQRVARVYVTSKRGVFW